MTIRYNEHVPSETPMNTTTAGIKLTCDDFLQFPDDGKRHELINGEHCVTSSPDRIHVVGLETTWQTKI